MPDMPPSITVPSASVACPAACGLISVRLGDEYGSVARLLEAPNPAQAVVYLHGIQSHSGWFLASAEQLRRSGVSVLMPDRRGSGLNAAERGHCEGAEQLLDDLDRAVNWLIQHAKLPQVTLLAVSWSGKLALAYAARRLEKVRRLILVAPGLCPRIDVSLPEKILIGLHGAIYPRRLHPIPLTEPELFTANPAKRAFIAHDPLMLKQATASFFLASRRLDQMACTAVGQLKIPIHLFLARHDRIIDNEATIKFLGQALAAPPRIYDDAHHTLEFEPDPAAFFADLAATI